MTATSTRRQTRAESAESTEEHYVAPMCKSPTRCSPSHEKAPAATAYHSVAMKRQTPPNPAGQKACSPRERK